MAAADREMRGALVEMGHAVERQAKINSTGPARWRRGVNLPRPGGPGVVTGTHRRSIHVKPAQRRGAWWEVRVGPSAVYSRRLELGFFGSDALGRRYRQPAYPYMRPALGFVIKVVAPQIVEKRLRQAVRRRG